MSINLFWDKSQKKKNRTRFNLLLLEYGEYFLDDCSAFLFPILPTNWRDKNAMDTFESLKIQGRLKLCSKSIVFEPIEVRKPVLKFPFKSITGEIYQPIQSSNRESDGNGGYFTFKFSNYVEIKANNKIGPYTYKSTDSQSNEEPSTNNGHACFGLVHANIQSFLVKLDALRKAFHESEKSNYRESEKILLPILDKASTVRFDSSMLVDFHEQLLFKEPVNVNKVIPLVSSPGIMMMTESRIYFQPSQVNNVGDSFQCIQLKDVAKVYPRRYLLRQIGLEFILLDGSSSLFTFENKSVRDSIYDIIVSQTSIMKDYKPLNEIVRMWQRRELSNFEYLMHLNNEADRSFNDLTQYPVFPHIIADYTSSKLDLESNETFRDLSKSIGALNPQRLRYFQERFESMLPADESMGIPPPFLYGTHYSTPAYVLYYLVRVAPEHMLCLQNGKFDATDRMFNSMSETWESCLKNPTDLKELIPEFFMDNSEFLVNSDDLDLGHRHTGGRLNDVELPPWAKSPRDFIRKLSKALESDFVSNHINEWIDLIFGYKAQGEEAIKANNLYYYLTYEGAIDIEDVTDPRKRNAIEIQIQEFGQTPRQLFVGPHPKRDDLNAPIRLKPTISILRNTIPISPAVSPRIGLSNSENSGNPIKSSLSQPTISQPQANTANSFASEFPQEEVKDTKSIQPNSNNSTSSSSESLASPMNSTLGFRRGIVREKISSYFSDLAKTASSVGESMSAMSSGIASSSTPKSFNSSNTQFTRDEKINDKWQNAQSMTQQQNAPRVSQERPAVRPIERTQSANTDATKSSIGTISSKAIVINQLIMSPSDAFAAHRNTITGIASSVENVRSSAESSDSFIKIRICSSSKDSVVKILEATSMNNAIFAKRNFTGSELPLTSCYITKDGNYAYATSMDNRIYAYSIPTARQTTSQIIHDDSVTKLAVDENENLLISGSEDGSVKVWKLKVGGISSIPQFEFFEHEHPISAVSVSSNGKVASSASIDGKVINWDLILGTEISSHHTSRSPVSALCWIPQTIENYYHRQEYALEKLICTTLDRKMVCLDSYGKLFAAVSLDVTVLCLACDGLIVYTGCDDGSLRCYIMESGCFREVYRHLEAHSTAVTAIHVDKVHQVLTSGGDDGDIRVWSIKIS